MAEYEALVNGMWLALEIWVNDLNVLSDLQLVVNQVRGVYEAWDETMKWYLAQVRELQYEFIMKNIPLQVDLILCTQNEEVDLLSQLTQEELEQLPQEVLVETVSQSSFEKPTPVKNVQSEPSWMDPVKENYSVIRMRQRKSQPKQGIICTKMGYYSKEGNTPWLRCVGTKEALVIIKEIHQGVCV